MMIYGCSCGLQATTATAIYNHLSQFKNDPDNHQLQVVARGPEQPAAPALGASSCDPRPHQGLAGRPAYQGISQGTSTHGPTTQPITQPEDSPAQQPQPSLPKSNHSPTLTPLASAASPSLPTLDAPAASTTGSTLRRRLNSLTGARAGSADGTTPRGITAQAPIDLDEIQLDLTQPRSSAGQQANKLSAWLKLAATNLTSMKASWAGKVDDQPAHTLSDKDNSLTPIPAETAPAISSAGLLSTAAPSLQAVAGSVSSVEDLLLWRQPWSSARVLGGGLYAIVCASQLSSGKSRVTPSSAVMSTALLVLAVNLVRLTSWSIKHSGKTSRAAAGQQQAGGPDAPPSSQPLVSPSSLRFNQHTSSEGGARKVSPSMQHAMDEEMRVYLVVHSFLARTAVLLIPALAGGAALCYRALSGRRLASSVLVAACLWVGMLLGELRLVSQAVFLGVCWLGLFTVPCAYIRSRAVADHLVEDVLRLLAGLLVHADRTTWIMAGTTCLFILMWAPAGLIMRTTGALLAVLAVLVYPRVTAGLNQTPVGSRSGQPVHALPQSTPPIANH